MKTRSALALAAALLLSGCFGGGEGGDRTPASSGVEPPGSGPAGGGGPPAWAVRDWWTYDTPLGEGIYVVTADQGADWFLDTTNSETAFLDARTDVSRLGPVRKSDLAGSQGEDRVEFFRWPLADGASWDTRWDGEGVTVTASAGPGDTFTFLAVNATAPMYRYTFDPAARWIGELHHLGADGEPDYSLRLRDQGHNFTGEVVRWSLGEVVAAAGSDGTATHLPFEVQEGVTDLWAEYHLTCTGAAGYTFALQPANPGLAAQQGAADSGPCAQVDWADVVQPEPHPGTWLFALDVGGQTADYAYALLVRTLERIPVG